MTVLKVKQEQSKKKEGGSDKPRWRGQKVAVPGTDIVKRPEGVPAVKLGKKGMPKHWGPKVRHKPRKPPVATAAVASSEKKPNKPAPPQQKTKVKMVSYFVISCILDKVVCQEILLIICICLTMSC